jgi:hypothetical protein
MTESPKADQWHDMAERDEYRTLTDFEKGIEWESGLDGHAFIGFYDRDRLLSFIWDGNVQTPVQVSYGGYGEPVKWKFWFNDHRVMNMGEPGFTTLVALFQQTCEAWIDAKEDAE